MKTRAWMCWVGLVVSLILTGLVSVGGRRAQMAAFSDLDTPLSGQAVWEGDWEFSALGADPGEEDSQTEAARVTIPFTGTVLALRVRRGAYRGNLWVSVDGEPANLLPQVCQDGTCSAYLVLTAPDYTPRVETVPVADGLGEGVHKALIVADRGWEQWPLVGWSAGRASGAQVYRWAAAGLAVLGLLCLVGGMGWGVARIEDVAAKESDAAVSGRQRPLRLPGAVLVALVIAAVFYVSPWPSLTLVSGLALAGLVLWRLDFGLALVAATAPFYRYPRPLGEKAFSMAEILVLLCLLSWTIKNVGYLRSPNRWLFRLRWLDWAVVGLALVAVVSTGMADFRHVALRELRVVVLEPALFYLMLRTARLDGKRMWLIVDGFVLGAVLVAVVGLGQYAGGINLITAEEGFRRLRSVYGSPNNAALYLGRSLPLLVAVALFGASRTRRALYGAAILPVGAAILLTFSKGALILGLPLSLLALGLLAGGRWLWVSLGAVAAAAGAAIPLLRTPRFASLFDTRGGTTFFRLQLWQSSWAMWRDHPWFGVGPDNFLYQYRGRYILPAAWQEPDLSHPHNILLDYGCRLGLYGLVVGLGLQAAFWRVALPLRRLSDRDRRALALGLMGGMVNMLAHGLVDVSYFVIDLAFAFFLALGVVEWLASDR